MRVQSLYKALAPINGTCLQSGVGWGMAQQIGPSELALTVISPCSAALR